MSTNPLLSIGMIVKNEIRCLEKCLKALQPLRDAVPCELVIADTGSTDGTREIAEKYADILFDFEWINDFSAARNAVIDRCAGKWFMTIDADEYLNADIREIVDFLTGPQADVVKFATYIQRNYQSADLKGKYTDFPAMRMARMATQPRYQGTIHEAFENKGEFIWISLDKTIVDHDGYAAITPDHWKKKQERNMKLLEKELEKDPDDLKRILQCLESCVTDKRKQRSYAQMAMERIGREGTAENDFMEMSAPIARQAVQFAFDLGLPEAEKWAKWSLERFPDSPFVQVDVNFLVSTHLYRAERYDEIAPYAQAYFDAVKLYYKNGFSSFKMLTSVVRSAHDINRTQVQFILGHVYRELGEDGKAISAWEKIDLREADDTLLIPWLRNMEKLAEKKKAVTQAGRMINKVLALKDSKDGRERGQYRSLIDLIMPAFTPQQDSEEEPWKLYRNVDGTIGQCVKIIEATDKTEVEALLSEIEDWNEFMPLALDHAITLGAELPDGFYRMKKERMHQLLSVLPTIGKEIVEKSLAYSEPDNITNLHQLSFAFTLVAVILTKKDILKGEQGEQLCQRFAELSAAYLCEFYNEALLSDEEAISCLPELHRFAWYYIQAWEQRETAQFFAFLREALHQSDEMRYMVRFLSERMIEKDKARRAEASAELVELAEKVRQILSAYAPDDPAVVALKQTPVYQQVAFLIENVQGLDIE